jgi:putative ABC transport system ATP-binding protein
MEITLTDIDKSYEEVGRRHTILGGVNARFASKQFTVILGKSGTGKSTLLNLIGGIDTPDQGAVQLGNTVLNQMTDHQRTLFRRQKIGFIFQFFNLIPTLTVMENVTLVSELDGRRPDEARESAITVLDRVGLGDRSEAMPDKLSGGEQQRVAIARALSNDPEIILADEPTGNLDEDTGRSILMLLEDLVKAHGKTLIMATHSGEAASRAKKVFKIKNRILVPSTDPISLKRI